MMDSDATLLNASPQVRQKRVLPSRSRRGGPGVGNCDVDLMILNAQLSKSDSEPLIPADTPFVLKTSDALDKIAEKFQEGGSYGLNLHAHERYFDKPEVLKSYREQTTIETPEYENVKDNTVVGNRLRQRNVEETILDSDATYEKRHRKFEAFEKRQRLREKEKLKHEQYKLKERIEQLRGMDNSAFLAAPASSFSSPPTGSEVNSEDIALGAMGVLGGLNGNPNTPAYQEGERRRQEMLMNATALEERYRVLLPPDRVRKPTGQSAANAETDSDLSSHELARSKDVGADSEDPTQTSKKLKIRLPGLPARLGAPNTTPKDSASKKRSRPSPPPPAQVPTHPPMSRSVRETMPQARVIMEAPVHRDYPDQIVFADPYNPDEEQRAPKRQRMSKRARTEERNERRPQTPSRDYSVPLPDQHLVVDDVPQPPCSPFRDVSPTAYSYPPPPRPPPYLQEDHHRLSDTNFQITPKISSPPRSLPPSKPTSPLVPSGSYFPAPYASQQSPLSDVVDPQEFENASAPGRGPSVPPIEALSSLSAPAAPARRGRSRAPRGGAGAEGATRNRKPPVRRVPDPMIVTVAIRNKHKSNQRRGREVWGTKLPEIILGSDAYVYELPRGIHPDHPFEDDDDDKMELDGQESIDEREEQEEEEDRKDQLEPMMQHEPKPKDDWTPELDVGT